MRLRRRVAALEAVLRPRGEPFAGPRYSVALEREILERRAVPLPPLDGVDLGATAELWARCGERHVLLMQRGGTCDATSGALWSVPRRASR